MLIKNDLLRILFFLCILSLIVYKISAENKLQCDSINISFIDGQWYNSNNECPDSEEMGHFKCLLYLSGATNNDEILKLTTTMYLGMSPMHITVKDKEHITKQVLSEPASSMNEQHWSLSIPREEQVEICIEYQINATISYFYPYFRESNYPNVFSLITDYGRFIPSHNEIEYSYCKVNAGISHNEKYTTFISWNYDNIDEPRVCVTVINNNVYKQEKVISDGVSISLYHTQEDLSLTEVNKLFTHKNLFKNIKNINIVLIEWNSKEPAAGLGYGCNGFVICDNMFSSDSGIIHETLHELLPVASYDKGKFFINESVIEWLAQYVHCGKFKRNDFYEQENTTPLYDIYINESSSWYQIYSDGPQFLQELSDVVGSEKLFSLIVEYYTNNNIKSYDGFINYLHTNLQEGVKELDMKVRGK